MAASIVCIAGAEVHRQWEAGRIAGERLGPRDTPFGTSGEFFRIEGDGGGFFLLSRHGEGKKKTAPHKVNSRANMYAIKDLGARHVLAWGPGGAVTHNIAVGDLVILNDLMDLTYLRAGTFFEDSPLGFLRQFPVFCPALSNISADVLKSMKLLYHARGIAAVCEGPRLETPAEIRRLATIGAEVVTHTFVPEVFLARELQLCYAAICYVVSYAETGSRYRPFTAGDLFGGLTQQSDHDRLVNVVAAISQIVSKVAATLPEGKMTCDCDKTMASHIREYDLPDDWRDWFA